MVWTLANAKTMVIFKAGNDCSVHGLATTDSARFSGSAPSQNLDVYGNLPVHSTALSNIDSICFFDGAIQLTADMLFNAAFAAPAVTDSPITHVTVDLRNRTVNDTAVIITDPIDLLDPSNNLVSHKGALAKAVVVIKADVPSGAWIKAYWSAGNSFFSENGWSAWSPGSGLYLQINSPPGRYLKLRFVLKAASTTQLPKLQGVTVCGNAVPGAAYAKSLQINSYQNEKIITGPYAFGWERRDQSKISGLITRFRLDTCGAQKTTEFEKVVALLDWVARRPKGSLSASPYPWDLDQVISSTGTIRGHCMSYAEVMVSALTGLGLYARHWAIEGIDNMNNHEVVEYWNNSRKKWIYLDPSLDTYYKSTATGQPLSIIEMHNIYITRDLLAIDVVDGQYHYGVYTTLYNWRSKHGYTTCGHMKLTERNNFHSQSSPSFDGFGQGFCGFSGVNMWHNWTDWKTPPYDNLHYDCGGQKITCHSGRVRDFWYTLNQASMKAKRTGEQEITVEFGESQPFFKQYRVSVDGGASTVAASPYVWTLHAGANSLQVVPEDDWGDTGISSTLTVGY
jgi:transglutaminase-like putative cysteine protease